MFRNQNRDKTEKIIKRKSLKKFRFKMEVSKNEKLIKKKYIYMKKN